MKKFSLVILLFINGLIALGQRSFNAKVSNKMENQLQSNFNVGATAQPQAVRPVSFLSEGLVLKGDLYLPPNFDEARQYPTVVVTGSWTSIKEQMAGLYAQKMAEKGFVALAFDFRYWGQSEGLPRQYENPAAKTQDIRNAVSYLRTLPFVDIDELSGLGICASAGYLAHAAAQDDRIKHLVTVAAWLHDGPVAKAIYDNWPEKYDGLLAKSAAAAEKFARTGQADYVLACSDTDPNAAMYVPNGVFPYYIDEKLGAIPAYTNRFAVMSWGPWLQFDGVSAGKAIHTPTLMVHSEKAALPDGARAFYSSLRGEKHIEWLNGYSQMDFYHLPAAVDAAVAKVAAHLQQLAVAE
jgi:uncharacterized protein